MPYNDLDDKALIKALDALLRAQAQQVQAHPYLLEIGMPLVDPVYPRAGPVDFGNNQRQPRFTKPAIFWGGSDVDPSLYDRPISRYCGGTNRKADEREATRMQDCIDNGQPIIGICRGAQLLNVVNGGILVQHVDGHAIPGEHPCTIEYKGDVLKCTVSSTHHQMMVAHKDGIIIGKGPAASGYHWDEVNEPYTYKYVTEVVYYPKTKSLCIQPHPEWMHQDKPFIKWINYFIASEFGMDPLNFTDEESLFLGRDL